MRITSEKQNPTQKKLLPDPRKNNLRATPKKEPRKEEAHNEKEIPLVITPAIADLIIQQNLS